jgi:hypothetical protein
VLRIKTFLVLNGSTFGHSSSSGKAIFMPTHKY